jgi:hypothetical protein
MSKPTLNMCLSFSCFFEGALSAGEVGAAADNFPVHQNARYTVLTSDCPNNAKISNGQKILQSHSGPLLFN